MLNARPVTNESIVYESTNAPVAQQGHTAYEINWKVKSELSLTQLHAMSSSRVVNAKNHAGSGLHAVAYTTSILGLFVGFHAVLLEPSFKPLHSYLHPTHNFW